MRRWIPSSRRLVDLSPISFTAEHATEPTVDPSPYKDPPPLAHSAQDSVARPQYRFAEWSYPSSPERDVRLY